MGCWCYIYCDGHSAWGQLTTSRWWSDQECPQPPSGVGSTQYTKLLNNVHVWWSEQEIAASTCVLTVRRKHYTIITFNTIHKFLLNIISVVFLCIIFSSMCCLPSKHILFCQNVHWDGVIITVVKSNPCKSNDRRSLCKLTKSKQMIDTPRWTLNTEHSTEEKVWSRSLSKCQWNLSKSIRQGFIIMQIVSRNTLCFQKQIVATRHSVVVTRHCSDFHIVAPCSCYKLFPKANWPLTLPTANHKHLAM